MICRAFFITIIIFKKLIKIKKWKTDFQSLSKWRAKNAARYRCFSTLQTPPENTYFKLSTKKTTQLRLRPTTSQTIANVKPKEQPRRYKWITICYQNFLETTGISLWLIRSIRARNPLPQVGEKWIGAVLSVLVTLASRAARFCSAWRDLRSSAA